MQKIQNAKMLTALALLFVLVISPLAVVYGQTSNTSVDLSTSGNITASGGSVKVDSSAKIVGDKLNIKDLREKIKSERAELKQLRTDERRATIAFTGQTDGWVLIGGIASKASISLKEGKAAKVGDHLWRISTNGTITAGSKNYDVHLKGKVEGNKRYGAIVSLHGTAMIGGEEHRIALSGYVAPTSIEKTFALAFTNLGYKGEEYHFIQVGQVTISPIVSGDVSSNQSQNDMASFRDTISVG